jgi:hypothetical protein
LQTALESCFIEPLEQAIHRNQAKIVKRKMLCQKDDQDMNRLYGDLMSEWDGDTLNVTREPEKPFWQRVKKLLARYK